MVSSLVCFLVLVLQVQFIRGQLAQNFRSGRSDVYEPGYTDHAGYQAVNRDLTYSDNVGQQKRTRNDARRLHKLYDTLKIQRNYEPNGY
ncbi:hypothetical protein ACROYT_G009458 [Oculina patagonica]